MEHIHFLKQKIPRTGPGTWLQICCQYVLLLAFSKIPTQNISVESSISSLCSKICEIHAFKENKTHLWLVLFEVYPKTSLCVFQIRPADQQKFSFGSVELMLISICGYILNKTQKTKLVLHKARPSTAITVYFKRIGIFCFLGQKLSSHKVENFNINF